ncbi:RNA polymerase sigma factor [Alkaliphilus crotonatoxidans]
MKEEKQWIRKIKKRNHSEAANSLITKYYREIYSYAYRQTLNKELAMDLTQEIFISALKSIKYYDEEKSAFRTWLYRIATNRIIDYFRSRHHQLSQLTISLDEHNNLEATEYDDFTHRIEYKEDIEKITELVGQLETSNQEIFRLKLFGEYSFLEIASLMKIPESTVKTRYYAMIKKIKKNLGEGK